MYCAFKTDGGLGAHVACMCWCSDRGYGYAIKIYICSVTIELKMLQTATKPAREKGPRTAPSTPNRYTAWCDTRNTTPQGKYQEIV